MTAPPVRVALDLMGGDHAPDAAVDGALLATGLDAGLEVVLVGPADVAGAALAARGADGRLPVVPAADVVGMAEDPARAVRAKRDASVRVAARLVRDGRADATVSAGPTGAVMAAALFTLGRLKGVTRPPLAVVVPAREHPVILLDAGANPDCGADLLAQFALAGSAYATVRLGLAEPRVGLLTIGSEPGKGDEMRREAYGVLAGLPIRFAGAVEGSDVVLGGRADVVVTDGFTGNVLLKGLEGAVAMLTARLAHAGALGPAAEGVWDEIDPERLGGGVLLGVDGVVVVAHGWSAGAGVAAAIGTAARAVREGLVPRVRDALAGLVALRRSQAGLA